MITYQVQEWQDARAGMEWLFPLHWEEVANNKDEIKLNVWYESYDQLDAAGELLIVTVKDESKIVGYHWSIIRPHLHYKDSLTAYTDIFFLHPNYRKGMTAVKLFKLVEKTLKDVGVQRMIASSKKKHDKSKIFQYLGWHESEIVYTKVI